MKDQNKTLFDIIVEQEAARLKEWTELMSAEEEYEQLLKKERENQNDRRRSNSKRVAKD